MRRSTISYFMCYLNVACALFFAMVHDLAFMLLTFFFAVFNWYVAEAQSRLERGMENETNEDRESTDSDGSDDNDETQD